MSNINLPDYCKPAPKHPKFRYEECYAKYLLEYLYPTIYSDLLIQDRPDIYDGKNDIGIEVTEAVEQDFKEAHELWLDLPQKAPEGQEKSIKRMEKLGYPYTGIIQSWPCQCLDKGIDSDVFEPIFTSYIKKLKRLNDGTYKLCKSYYLVLLLNCSFRTDWYTDCYRRMKELETEYGETYEKIYMQSGSYVIELDFKTDTIQKYSISAEMNEDIISQADYLSRYGIEKRKETP